jgi:serine/threonine protein kinase
LISDDSKAMLCDFGLVTFSELHSVASTTSSSIQGSLRWNAPEIIHSSEDAIMRKTTATDVYAMGMTILEASAFYILRSLERLQVISVHS